MRVDTVHKGDSDDDDDSKKRVNVKQSRYRPEVAQRVPGS
jgi:hypothetical protein